MVSTPSAIRLSITIWAPVSFFIDCFDAATGTSLWRKSYTTKRGRYNAPSGKARLTRGFSSCGNQTATPTTVLMSASRSSPRSYRSRSIPQYELDIAEAHFATALHPHRPVHRLIVDVAAVGR